MLSNMKKVGMILLSVTTLLVSCAKQTTITTEQTDLTTEILTQTASGTTEPSAEVTESSEAPTEEVSEAPSEEDTTAATEPDEPISTPKEGIYADLEKINIPVIGEFSTIEDAFAGYPISAFTVEDDYGEWDDFWEEYEELHPIGYKEGFYIGENMDAGFLVEIVASETDGSAEAEIQSVYAFNTLYKITPTTKPWVYKEFCKSGRPIYITDDIAATIRRYSIYLWYKGGSYHLKSKMHLEDGFGYDAYVEDGVMHYMRFRYVTHMQSFYDWAKEYWYPGYGDELALEIGTLTLVNGELIFTPDETYTVEEWLMVYAHMEEKLQKSGYGTLDEYMDAYLYGELNPYKKS